MRRMRRLFILFIIIITEMAQMIIGSPDQHSPLDLVLFPRLRHHNTPLTILRCVPRSSSRSQSVSVLTARRQMEPPSLSHGDSSGQRHEGPRVEVSSERVHGGAVRCLEGETGLAVRCLEGETGRAVPAAASLSSDPNQL
ncbi:unnamed protein product [Pleuronectes platessa]|uniref:Secreted protein n=1 Tax=Pleuronectes platessa TaxID=8262 RepID=A0A9N7V175_PLEPL|nr:unnamed protein product [Pleuronectes platessa]